MGAAGHGSAVPQERCWGKCWAGVEHLCTLLVLLLPALVPPSGKVVKPSLFSFYCRKIPSFPCSDFPGPIAVASRAVLLWAELRRPSRERQLKFRMIITGASFSWRAGVGKGSGQS